MPDDRRVTPFACTYYARVRQTPRIDTTRTPSVYTYIYIFCFFSPLHSLLFVPFRPEFVVSDRSWTLPEQLQQHEPAALLCASVKTRERTRGGAATAGNADWMLKGSSNDNNNHNKWTKADIRRANGTNRTGTATRALIWWRLRRLYGVCRKRRSDGRTTSKVGQTRKPSTKQINITTTMNSVIVGLINILLRVIVVRELPFFLHN